MEQLTVDDAEEGDGKKKSKSQKRGIVLYCLYLVSKFCLMITYDGRSLYNQLCVAELKGRVGWSHKGYCSVYLTFALMWLNQENFATNDKCINNFIKP